MNLPLPFTALVATLGVIAPVAAEAASALAREHASCSDTEIDERLKVTFVGRSGGDAGGTLAVRWTGREAVRFSAWVDLDADGVWQESERVVAAAGLSPGIETFDFEVPPRGRIDHRTRLRLRLEGGGRDRVAPARESVRRLFGAGGGPAGCGWAPGFNDFDLDSGVSALVVYDDGTGPALYAGGSFVAAGELAVKHVAKWDGSGWSALSGPAGTGTDGGVLALAVYDDGTGPALYAGGSFTAAGGVPAVGVAKWDGTGWSGLLGTSEEGLVGTVHALAVYDDGTGSALYAGGFFFQAGGVTANHVARWDGTDWSPLTGPSGTGTDERVRALAVYDDGSGPALYAGGFFTDAGGVVVNSVARWNGMEWRGLGGPSGTGTDAQVLALAVYDDGAGPALHAAGFFSQAGGVTVNHVAKWNGTAWSPLSGPSGTGTDDIVHALAVYDDGSGPALYAGGELESAGGVAAGRIAKWDGTEWSALSGPLGTGILGDVASLAVYADGAGPALYVGGGLSEAGGVPANNIARWDGGTWSVPGSGSGSGIGSRIVFSLAVYDDGAGPALYAGGDFEEAGGVEANAIARWDGASWSALSGPAANGLDSSVRALAVYDDGSGPALYAGGEFSQAGGVPASFIARWDGTAWSALGGSGTGGTNGTVAALAVYDDGTGPALYAGGTFTEAGGVTVNHVARWDGAGWSALPGPGGPGTDGLGVGALAVYDDGGGPALYVGGSFSAAGGVAVNNIARWDGGSWSALSGPSETGVDGRVNALAVHDDGTGPALYAAGIFSDAGGVFVGKIARWDGTAWSPLTGALGTGIAGVARSLAVFDGRYGPALHVGGELLNAGGGLEATHVARWDGSDWTLLDGPAGEGIDGRGIWAMAVFDDGEPALYAGGWFGLAGGVASRNIARWTFCTPRIFADGFESGDTTAWSSTTP